MLWEGDFPASPGSCSSTASPSSWKSFSWCPSWTFQFTNCGPCSIYCLYQEEFAPLSLEAVVWATFGFPLSVLFKIWNRCNFPKISLLVMFSRHLMTLVTSSGLYPISPCPACPGGPTWVAHTRVASPTWAEGDDHLPPAAAVLLPT